MALAVVLAIMAMSVAPRRHAGAQPRPPRRWHPPHPDLIASAVDRGEITEAAGRAVPVLRLHRARTRCRRPTEAPRPWSGTLPLLELQRPLDATWVRARRGRGPFRACAPPRSTAAGFDATKPEHEGPPATSSAVHELRAAGRHGQPVRRGTRVHLDTRDQPVRLGRVPRRTRCRTRRADATRCASRTSRAASTGS